ncbi:MAG TPA: glycoside hydrolase family protein [Anaerohalosphaeraceae bacterium]|nr:glycoside hydrolase family protein [Anaerohalosphaeraceae bacterium]
MKKKNISVSGLIIFLWVFISFPQTGMGLINEAATNSSGQDKAELNLEEMVQPVPMTHGFHQDGYFVWCGAPVQGDDGRYHLFYSRWPVSKGFAPGWAIWSEIAYAIADCPEGPYQFVNVALPARGLNPATGQKYWDGDVTHNPYILRKKGKYYLYYMGNHGDGTYAGHRNNQRIGLAIAENPGGPWSRFDAPIVDISPDKSAFDSLCVTNPAVAIQPDGGVLLIYKAVQIVEGKLMGGNVRFGAAKADRIEGPYIKIPGRIFESGNQNDAKQWMLAEDPFIWYSQRYGNKYYAIVRDVTGTFCGANGGLALFQSLDGLDWKPAKYSKVLGTYFKKSDDSFSESRVERPFLLFDENEVPIYLFGATDGYEPKGRISYNVQIPLKIPAYQLPQSNDKSLHVQNQKESAASTIFEERMGDSCPKTYRIMPIGDSITKVGKPLPNFNICCTRN